MKYITILFCITVCSGNYNILTNIKIWNCFEQFKFLYFFIKSDIFPQSKSVVILGKIIIWILYSELNFMSISLLKSTVWSEILLISTSGSEWIITFISRFCICFFKIQVCSHDPKQHQLLYQNYMLRIFPQFDLLSYYSIVAMLISSYCSHGNNHNCGRTSLDYLITQQLSV